MTMTSAPQTSSRTERRPTLLIVSPDVVDKKMAGPGIRCWELARVLSHECAVTLAVPNQDPPPSRSFSVQSYRNRRPLLADLTKSAEAILVQGLVLEDFPFLAEPGKRVIVDLYAPYHLEVLNLFGDRPPEEVDAINDKYLAALTNQLLRGDFFICASERQRDFWIGMLSALGRINRRTHAADSSLRRLIDVVAFGLSATEPVHTRQVLKGVFPGIRWDDLVLLWGGGLWDWLDPLTPITAMPRILDRHPRAKLFFLGPRHPAGFEPGMAARARRCAAELGLIGHSIFFNEGWVAYEDRVNFLLEADLGLSAGGAGLEARYAFRTRLLDYFWARLPVVSSDGDDLSERAARYNVGRVAPPGDVRGWAQAVVELLDQRSRGGLRPEAFEALRQSLTWERVAEPLARYCRAPYPADDAMASGAPEAAELVHLRRTAQVQARQIAELQDTLAAQGAYVKRIESARVMKLLHTLMRLLGREPRAGSARRE
jgi:hypothetical protein